MNRRVSQSRAFTIIELVIVLAVLGLVVGLTAPRLVNSSAKAQVRDATRGLVDALTAQRAEAIRSMAPARLYLVSGGSESGFLRLVESSGDEATGETLAAMLTRHHRIDEPFSLLGVWKGAELVSSNRPDALPGDWPRAWDIRALVIEPTGRARLEGGETSLALVASHGGDTIWRIEFDPISGVPAARSD